LNQLFRILLLIYVATGNLSRFSLIPGLTAPILELTATAIGWCSIFLVSSPPRRIVLAVAIFVFGSFIWGMTQRGFDLSAIFYGIRLIGVLLAGDYLGRLLAKSYEGDRTKSIKKILNYFLFFIFISWLIFFFYQDSTVLWSDLSSIGVSFDGDPHQGRLVSLLFDPNYFSVIAVLPILMILSEWDEFNTRYKWFFVWIVLGAIIFSFSRSGLAVLIACVSYSIYKRSSGQKNAWLLLMKRLGLLVLLCVLILFFSEPGERILERIISVAEDESALARIENNRVGLLIFLDHPWLGVGYNYVSIIMKDMAGAASPDSSLINMLANFGGFGGLLFFSIYFYSFLKGSRTSLGYQFYVAACFVFASIFNNLLFYSYWVFLTSVFGSIIRQTAARKVIKR